jgi:ribosomal protein S18 acetylase RimI-like enzyme
MHIRRAELSDAEQLVELASRTYYDTFAPVNTPENMQAYISSAFTVPQFRAELNEPKAAFYVAEVDGSLGGYAKLLTCPPPECVTGPSPIELVRLYVDRPWQGTGVAGKLIERCIADAKRQGRQTMYLGVWEHNQRAIAFYRKWGFVRVGEHIFQMGDDPQTDWWMVRSIEL